MDDDREQELLSHEAIMREPWNAVYLPLPEAPSAGLRYEIHWNAEYCYEGATHRAENPDWPGQGAYEPQLSDYSPAMTLEEHAKNALARLEELERLDPSLERMNPRGIGTELEARGSEIESALPRSDETDRHSDRALDANPAKSPSDPERDKFANVEVTDRMRRLLDQPDIERPENEEQRDQELGLDLHHDNSGGGRTRGR